MIIYFSVFYHLCTYLTFLIEFIHTLFFIQIYLFISQNNLFLHFSIHFHIYVFICVIYLFMYFLSLLGPHSKHLSSKKSNLSTFYISGRSNDLFGINGRGAWQCTQLQTVQTEERVPPTEIQTSLTDKPRKEHHNVVTTV